MDYASNSRCCLWCGPQRLGAQRCRGFEAASGESPGGTAGPCPSTSSLGDASSDLAPFSRLRVRREQGGRPAVRHADCGRLAGHGDSQLGGVPGPARRGPPLAGRLAVPLSQVVAAWPVRDPPGAPRTQPHWNPRLPFRSGILPASGPRPGGSNRPGHLTPCSQRSPRLPLASAHTRPLPPGQCCGGGHRGQTPAVAHCAPTASGSRLGGARLHACLGLQWCDQPRGGQRLGGRLAGGRDLDGRHQPVSPCILRPVGVPPAPATTQGEEPLRRWQRGPLSPPSRLKRLRSPPKHDALRIQEGLASSPKQPSWNLGDHISGSEALRQQAQGGEQGARHTGGRLRQTVGQRQAIEDRFYKVAAGGGQNWIRQGQIHDGPSGENFKHVHSRGEIGGGRPQPAEVSANTYPKLRGKLKAADVKAALPWICEVAGTSVACCPSVQLRSAMPLAVSRRRPRYSASAFPHLLGLPALPSPVAPLAEPSGQREACDPGNDACDVWSGPSYLHVT